MYLCVLGVWVMFGFICMACIKKSPCNLFVICASSRCVRSLLGGHQLSLSFFAKPFGAVSSTSVCVGRESNGARDDKNMFWGMGDICWCVVRRAAVCMCVLLKSAAAVKR